MSRVRVIAILPPYIDHRRLIIEHPRIDELRFNSISPVADIALLLRLGYRPFMLSDTLCFRGDAFVAAMDVLSQLLPR